jgi:hypothetical protein
MVEFNRIEKEAIILNAIWGMIDSMVNFSMFAKFENNSDVMLRPVSSAHQQLFNVLFADFLSSPSKSTFALTQQSGPKTYLNYLLEICESPQLGSDVKLILDPVEKFSSWLSSEVHVSDVWFPSISLNASLRLCRIEFLKICGNIAKHNFSRLDVDARKLRLILERNGYSVDEAREYSILKEFYERFHNDILNYHLSAIAEFLNNIRWGIFSYLSPEFRKSYQQVDGVKYVYNIPIGIKYSLSQEMYWELMNMVRSGPIMKRFEVADIMKARY